MLSECDKCASMQKCQNGKFEINKTCQIGFLFSKTNIMFKIKMTYFVE